MRSQGVRANICSAQTIGICGFSWHIRNPPPDANFGSLSVEPQTGASQRESAGRGTKDPAAAVAVAPSSFWNQHHRIKTDRAPTKAAPLCMAHRVPLLIFSTLRNCARIKIGQCNNFILGRIATVPPNVGPPLNASINLRLELKLDHGWPESITAA